jgi:hypothetical protein
MQNKSADRMPKKRKKEKNLVKVEVNTKKDIEKNERNSQPLGS